MVVPTSASQQDSHKADDGDNKEDDEEDLCDTGGARRDAREAEQCGDERDDQKHDGIVQHGKLLSEGSSLELRLSASAACPSQAAAMPGARASAFQRVNNAFPRLIPSRCVVLL